MMGLIVALVAGFLCGRRYENWRAFTERTRWQRSMLNSQHVTPTSRRIWN